MGENFVRIANRLCQVCGARHESNEILLHKRMRDIPEDQTLIGWGVCPTCEGLREEYIAVVEVDETKTPDRGELNREDAYRTGRVFHIRRTAFAKMFNFGAEIAASGLMVYAPIEIGDKLLARQSRT